MVAKPLEKLQKSLRDKEALATVAESSVELQKFLRDSEAPENLKAPV